MLLDSSVGEEGFLKQEIWIVQLCRYHGDKYQTCLERLGCSSLKQGSTLLGTVGGISIYQFGSVLGLF